MPPHGNAHNRAMRSTSEEEQGPEAESGARGPRGIQSVEVGGQLLKVLAHTGRRMALKDLAREADMSPAKAHPYLVSFGKLGLIEQDGVSGHYGLGPLALQLGLISLQQVDPVQLANAELPALAQRLGHTVSASVWGARGPTIIRVEEGPTAVYVAMRHGTTASVRHTASGQVFAAYRPREDVAMALASPVFNGFDQLVLVLACIGPSATLDTVLDGPVALALKACAQDLSRRLGATG